jgi:hypothetical protein
MERQITPEVSSVNEFLEIASDFGDPLEIIREAISNAYDAKATEIRIEARPENINGYDKLVLEFTDNGVGMSSDVLEHNFWDLGNSNSRNDQEKIGEKGHGTKIFLRSDRIFVQTINDGIATESECLNPFQSLSSGNIHKPIIRENVQNIHISQGTYIRIEGYNNNQFTKFVQMTVKDYIFWFTKLGSFESEFNLPKPDFKVQLKMADKKASDNFEILEFGHKFPEENKNITKLFEEYDENAIEYFVKKYVKSISLHDYPYVDLDMVIYVEGDKAKRSYNPCLGSRKVSSYYKVSDRYGIWLSKDYIPIERKNEWITSFGKGSNAFVLLHGFINCQKMSLTANRGTITNTDIGIRDAIKKEVQDFISEIDEDLYRNDLYTLQTWQQESKTTRIEEIEFGKRKESISSRKVIKVNDSYLLEPRNETETFGYFLRIYEAYKNHFEFEPLDYNSNNGIDIIARNTSSSKIADCEYWYVEMKHILTKNFNHSFKNLRWIVCWDFDKNIKNGSEMKSNVDSSQMTMKFEKKDGNNCYFLDIEGSRTRIQVLRLKEISTEILNLKIEDQS